MIVICVVDVGQKRISEGIGSFDCMRKGYPIKRTFKTLLGAKETT